MTHDKQPVTLTEGCFGVTRGGKGVPQEAHGPVTIDGYEDGEPMFGCTGFVGGQWAAVWRKEGTADFFGSPPYPVNQTVFDIIATFPTRAAAEAYLRGEPEGKRDRGKMLKPLPGAPCGGYPGEPEGAMRCAECDCKNGGAECTWIATPTPDPAELTLYSDDQGNLSSWLPQGDRHYPASKWRRVDDAECDPADQAELIASLRQVIADMQDRGGEPVAARYDFDGYGWRYLDSGSGSDWKKRAALHDDCEWLYAAAVLISAARGETQ